jgi:hypothetical protein
MSVREQKLEEALAEAQSSISTEPHPLLVRDTQIRMASPVPGLQRPTKVGAIDAPPPALDTTADELVASLGMMSLNEKSYHGETASSEVCGDLQVLSILCFSHLVFHPARHSGMLAQSCPFIVTCNICAGE